MQYDFSNQVTAALDALDEDTRRQLFSNIMALPEFGDIKALEGRHAGLYRQRIGDWRVIFAMEDDNVLVGYILPPRDAGEGAGNDASRDAGSGAGAAAGKASGGAAPAAAPGSIAGNIGIAAVESVKKSADKGAGKKSKDKGKDKKKKKDR